ncbi:MAG: 2,3,4,5-tetrahydropyridine-2,6-dicarboxylate N-succinyltransferase, partial [Pseudomonadota bacterium]
MNTDELKRTIDEAFETRASLSPDDAPAHVCNAVATALNALAAGTLRIAEPAADDSGQWTVHEWLKKAVLLYFRLHDNQVVPGGAHPGVDKVTLKYTDTD